MRTRTIQAKVMLGEGRQTLNQSVEFNFADPGIFMVENINEWFELESACVSCNNTVTVSGWLYKNVAYKEVDPATGVDTTTYSYPVFSGAIMHKTTRIPVSTCIVVEPENVKGLKGRCLKLRESDKVEVCTNVSSSSDKLLNPILDTADSLQVPGIYNYQTLQENMCLSIAVQVYRWEEIQVPFDYECSSSSSSSSDDDC